MKRMIVLAGVLLAVGCAPTEDEFTSSCLERCIHETLDCGLEVSGDCFSFCDDEWATTQNRSSDCIWYTVYWQDCRAEADCGAIVDATACRSQLADVAAYCL